MDIQQRTYNVVQTITIFDRTNHILNVFCVRLVLTTCFEPDRYLYASRICSTSFTRVGSFELKNKQRWCTFVCNIIFMNIEGNPPIRTHTHIHTHTTTHTNTHTHSHTHTHHYHYHTHTHTPQSMNVEGERRED